MICQRELMALFAKKPQIIKPGLERIKKALQILRDRHPEEAVKEPPIILVGGTNGKGTTAGYLYQLLVAAGFRVGIFSSPHLLDFAERIQHSHVPITDEKLVLSLQELKERLKERLKNKLNNRLKDDDSSFYDELSFFEVNTLLARQVFLETGCDFWIFEVGMGGQWDATNAFEPCLSIITTIGLDHQEYLGPDTRSIAREKSGIMRPGKPVIWGGEEESDAEAHDEIGRQAQSLGAILIRGGLDIMLRDQKEWPLPEGLRGAPLFLKQNFMKAWAAFSQLCSMGLIKASPLAVLSQVDLVPKPPSLWARFHEVSGAPAGYAPRSLILDVAHNPQGALALQKAIQKSLQTAHPKSTEGTPARMPGLISILKDKDCNGILDTLRGVLDPVILFGNQSERGFTKADLEARHHDLPFLENFPLAWEALDQRLKSLPQSGQVHKILVAGSVYALGEVLGCLGIGPLRGESSDVPTLVKPSSDGCLDKRDELDKQDKQDREVTL